MTIFLYGTAETINGLCELDIDTEIYNIQNIQITPIKKHSNFYISFDEGKIFVCGEGHFYWMALCEEKDDYHTGF